MKTKAFTLLAGGLLFLNSLAQQDAGFSQYFFNQLEINPAYAGSREAFSGTLINRTQWYGMQGSPETQSINMNGPVPNSRVGLGLQIYNDQEGPMRNTGVQATYSYYIPVGSYKLAFGLQGALNDLTIFGNQLVLENKNDPVFPTTVASSLVPDASFGIYLYKNRFYAGASATHLLEPKFGDNNTLMSEAAITEPAMFYRHYYLISGIVFKLNEIVDLRPSIQITYVPAAPVNIGYNASLIFYQKYFAGIGMRTAPRIGMEGTDNVFIAMIEYEVGTRFRIGASYDSYLNATQQYNNGTFELMLGWDLNISKTNIVNPRFF